MRLKMSPATNANVFSGLKEMRPEQNGRFMVDDIFKCTFLNENCNIFIQNFIGIYSQRYNKQ